MPNGEPVVLLVTAPVKIGRVVYQPGEVATLGEKLATSLLSLGVARKVDHAIEGPPVNRMISRAPVVKA